MIKLKSKSLIEFYGRDTLSADDFSGLTELRISGNGSKMDKQEARLFEDDLSSINQITKTLWELRLDNIDMTNISIKRLLKETHYDDLSFDGSDELFEQLKNTEVTLSDITRYNLGFDEEGPISEYELFRHLKTSKQFALFPIIDIQDLELALKYIDISEVKVKIRTPQDFEKLQSLMNGNEIEIYIDVNDLKDIDKLRNNPSFKINLNIRDMSELSMEDLEDLKGYNINIISMEEDLDAAMENYSELFLGRLSNSREKYDLETYIKLRKAIDSVIQGIDKNSPDIEKFLTVYKRLGEKISYDHEESERINPETGATYDSYPPDHNLVGGLLDNTCVCEGYAKILKQCLACVGIESKIIIGYASTECHAWNQVKLDGVWYNVDLTWDAVNIKENRELDSCLQGDVEFIGHSMESFIASPCEKSYDRNYIHKFLGIPFAFDIEDKDYTVPEILELIQNLNQSAVTGTRIDISKDSDTGEYNLSLGHIVNEYTTKHPETSIKITPKNLATFLQEYSKTFNITENQVSAFSNLAKTSEGVEIMIDENLKTDMLNYGVTTDKVLVPSKQSSTSLIDISSITIWSRISNSIKSTFKKIQQNLFSKNNNEKDENTFSIPQPAKSQRTSGWTFKNWPTDTLEVYAIQSKKQEDKKIEPVTTTKDDDSSR